MPIWITSDLSVINNVYATSLQDTIYAAQIGSGNVPARQYWFRGKVTGTVDYIFGDAAAAFDYTSIYTVPHGTGVSGTATIEAQNKAVQTGSSNDYLSGYVMNSNVFTSQTTGMTGLEFGRPYGTYSTWIMLNSYVDQVEPARLHRVLGLDTNLPTSHLRRIQRHALHRPGHQLARPQRRASTSASAATPARASRGTTRDHLAEPRHAHGRKCRQDVADGGQAHALLPRTFLGSTVSNSATSVTNWIPTGARHRRQRLCAIEFTVHHCRGLQRNAADASANPRPGRGHQRRLHHSHRHLHADRHGQRVVGYGCLR